MAAPLAWLSEAVAHHLPRWLMLSACVHAAIGFAIARQRAAPRGQRASVAPLQLELVTMPPTGSHSSPGADPRGPPSTESVTAPSAPPRRAVRARTSPVPTRSLEPPPAAGHEPAPPAAEPVLRGDDRTSFTLSPRAAALSSLETPAAEPERPSAEDQLERAIMEGAARPVDRVPDPVLIPRPEGGYAYKGAGFEAIIAPNGDLTMKDRYGSVALPFVPFQTPSGEWRIAIFGGTFRLYEWLDRKFGKNDPYASERRWFLERTRALREDLLRKHAPHFDEPAH